jgi:adenylate cyclase
VIAGHLEAAGDFREAFSWHMRAGNWFTNRDINAARKSWRRAQGLADQLPAGEPDRRWMRIAPRALLCGSTWRAGGSVADTGFDELRALCTRPEDQVALAMGMAGLLSQLSVGAGIREASRLASEYVELIDSIGQPGLTVGLLYPAIHAKYVSGEMVDVEQLAQRVIDLAQGDPTRGNFLTGSPLAFATAMRAAARCALGREKWKDGFDQAIEISQVDATTYISIVMFKYALGIPSGALLPDVVAHQETADAMQVAERCSEDFALHMAQLTRGIVMVSAESGDRKLGFDLLEKARSAAVGERFSLTTVPTIDLQTAVDMGRSGDLDMGRTFPAHHRPAAQDRGSA